MKSRKKTKAILKRLLLGSWCVLMLVLTFFLIKYIGKLSNAGTYANAGSIDTVSDAYRKQNTVTKAPVTEAPVTAVPTPKAEFLKEYEHLGEAKEVFAYESGIAYGLRYPVYEDEAWSGAVKAAAEELLAAQLEELSGVKAGERKLVIDYEDGTVGELVSVLFRIEREIDGVTESEKEQWIFNKKKGETVDAETLFADRAYVYIAEQVNEALAKETDEVTGAELSDAPAGEAEETEQELTGNRETFSSYLLTADGAEFYYEVNGEEESVTIPYAALHTYMAVTVNGNVVADSIRELDPDKPMIALTYDDGPHYINTPRLLEILEENGARATFFVLGERTLYTESNKNTVKMIYESGNELGSHTHTHVDLATLSAEAIVAEITNARETIYELTGEYPTFVRPPYGSYNDTVKKYANAPLITWNVDSEDWKSRNTDMIVEEVMSMAADRRIVLMHDIHTCTVDAAEILIPKLIEEGYQLVTLRELFYYKGVELENGRVYHNGYN